MRSHPSRFTQYELFSVEEGHESSVARKAARVNDDRVAEGAYATKAALDYVHGLRPELVGKPVVLIGMSGGAMMLPTVYAYASDSYDGAVLIAGGADFLSIAIESNYRTWIDASVFDFKAGTQEVRLNTDLGKPTKEQLATLSSVYLEHSKLDAYQTASEMGGIPVLMLHASLDQAVPASSGQLLYERLGEPDRWSYPLGHELIFAGLPTQVTRIDRWITKHVIEPMDED
jgi:predicted esterase